MIFRIFVSQILSSTSFRHLDISWTGTFIEQTFRTDIGTEKQCRFTIEESEEKMVGDVLDDKGGLEVDNDNKGLLTSELVVEVEGDKISLHVFVTVKIKYKETIQNHTK